MPPVEGPPPEETKSVIGFIYPPPEVRNIVDKTANFVARNGPEFEARIRQNEQNNPKFNFLNVGDPYHAYYQHKVEEIQSGKADEDESIPAAPHKQSTLSQQQHQKQQELLRAAVQESAPPKEPPPEFEFIADPPSISSFDLDVVRLTAQFVARNGRPFLTTLMNREQRNNQFDFLRPQHSLFHYFTKLLEQYAKVLIPPKDLMKQLQKEATDPQVCMSLVKQRVDWTKHQAAMKQKEEEEVERERMEYASIDWHDFSVVETIDYQPWEVGSFPPPTTPQEVGKRVLMQERIDEGIVPDNDMVIDSDEEGEQANEEVAADRDDTQVQDMEEESSSESEDSDEEEQDEEGSTSKIGVPPPPPPKEPPQPVPMPPTPGQVVVKEYNPKQQKTSQENPSNSDEFLVSPLTGERVPADKVGLHLKINMLDPRWLENRDRQLSEKSNQETVFATGDSVKSSLKQLAERRTDIFGAGDEETGIGKKIGEEEERRGDDKVTWDGYSVSVDAATRAARANISINDQIHQIHLVKGLLPDQEKEKIGPQPNVSTHAPLKPVGQQQQQSLPPAPQPNPPQPPQPKHVVSVALPKPPAPPVVPPPAPPAQPAPPIVNVLPVRPPLAPMPHMMQNTGMMMMPRPPVLMQQGPPTFVPSNVSAPPVPPVGFLSSQPPLPVHTPSGAPPLPPSAIHPPMSEKDDEEGGPPMKKLRTEESLVSEAEWAQKYPGPVNFKVSLPLVTDKPEWKLNGQTLDLALPLNDPVSVVKARIHDETGLPPGKQKLARDGLFFKDAQSLAFYNISPGTLIQLQLKERGGRKK